NNVTSDPASSLVVGEVAMRLPVARLTREPDDRAVRSDLGAGLPAGYHAQPFVRGRENGGMTGGVEAQLSALLGPLRRAVLRRTRVLEGLPDLPEAQIELLRLLVAHDGLAPGRAAVELKVAQSTVSKDRKSVE